MTDKYDTDPFAGAEIISVYTRAQAIADGAFIDVTEHAKAHLFKHPVAITASCYYELVSGYSRWKGCPEEARLHEVLNQLAGAARHSPPIGDRIRLVVSTRDGEGVPYLVEVIAALGPGDDGSPVITVMLPEDD